ncbi:uncharacterized protein ACB058_005574 [Synchiropus picturatus]
MGFPFLDQPESICVWILGALLLVSLAFNIYCCARRKYRCGCRRRKSNTSEIEMKDNPIYGNVVYGVADGEEMVDASLPHSHSSLRAKLRPSLDTRDCYAKLSLRATREKPGGCSSQDILYSDVICLEESRREPEENADTTSTLSGLYATVSTQRFKSNMMVSDSQDNYANNV